MDSISAKVDNLINRCITVAGVTREVLDRRRAATTSDAANAFYGEKLWTQAQTLLAMTNIEANDFLMTAIGDALLRLSAPRHVLSLIGDDGDDPRLVALANEVWAKGCRITLAWEYTHDGFAFICETGLRCHSLSAIYDLLFAGYEFRKRITDAIFTAVTTKNLLAGGHSLVNNELLQDIEYLCIEWPRVPSSEQTEVARIVAAAIEKAGEAWLNDSSAFSQ